MPQSRIEVDEIDRMQTAFNLVVARRRGRWIDLDVEGATFASYHPKFLLTGYSWDGLAGGALLSPVKPERLLMLGLGGGTALRQLRRLLPDAELVAVEIDAGVVDLARRHMALEELGVEVVVADAADFLGHSHGGFDVVIDDIYICGPEDVLRPDADVPEGRRLEQLVAQATPDGIVVANLIVDDGHHEVFGRARGAFLDTFQQVRQVRPPRGLNTILVGGRSLSPSEELDRYVDRFSEPHDQRLWEQIVVSPLQ